METMQTPATRAEFERRFHLLREKIKNGKMFFAKGMGLNLLNVRFLPNGRIDFLSIDESTRLQANMMTQFESETFEKDIKNKEIVDEPDDSSQ
jgi:hypothetical protein